MSGLSKSMIEGKTNFVFVGGAGSGKSEISINFCRFLTELHEKPVHFFDLDMTKPLFRSRDVIRRIEDMGVIFHHEEQFYDAPVMVGGVNRQLRDDSAYCVLDVGGDHIGARSIGAYAPRLNHDNTAVYYVLNAFRPWSEEIDQVDHTLGMILGASHIHLDQLRMVNNPNAGITTTIDEFLEGLQKMETMIRPYRPLDFACVQDSLYAEAQKRTDVPLLPLKLFLTYEWLE